MKQLSTQGKNRLVKWIFISLAVIVLLRGVTEGGGDTIVATDDQGSQWQITSAKGPPLRNRLKRELKPGPPLSVGTSVRRQGSIVLLDLVIKGQAGETYRPRLTKDGKPVRSSAPSFKVLGRSGKEVGSGKFQFG